MTKQSYRITSDTYTNCNEAMSCSFSSQPNIIIFLLETHIIFPILFTAAAPSVKTALL